MGLTQDGRMDAFETLVKRYESPLFNYIRRMLGGAADAQDVFQETFLRVYIHRERFRVTARFRPWVYRIATNLCRDQLRKRRRRSEVSLEQPISQEDAARELGDTMENPTPNPRECAIAAETAERLEAALARLPERHRAVFLMARYEGMAYGEIAGVLRVPVGTVKSRMNKAVTVLMDEMQRAAP